MKIQRTPSLLVVLCLALPLSLYAQATPRGSRYLSLDHPAYEAIQRLMDRGYLPGLNPLSQPYTRDQIARGVVEIAPEGLTGPEVEWVTLLREELVRELRILGAGEAGPEPAESGSDAPAADEEGGAMGWRFLAGASASSSRRLDPLMPYRDGGEDGLDTEAGAWPRYAVGGWGEIGRYAVDVRLNHDFWMEGDLDGDPDGLDPGGIAAFNRTDNAYVSARFSHGAVFAGRMRRNWAPLGSVGLMLSDVATTIPQLGFEIGGKGLQVEFMVGEMEAIPHYTGVEYKRWLVANRISYRREDFAISVGEAKVVGKLNHGGPGLRYLNPAELFFFDDQGEPRDTMANLVLDGQIWARRGNLVLYGEALLDDIDVTPEEGKDREPLTYALSLGGRMAGVLPWLDLEMEYRRVSAFAYRNYPPEQWSFLDRGLGDPWSDYDRITLRASAYPGVRGLRITPFLAYQRKGEGDFRLPLPPNEEHLASPSLFLGTVESTARLGLQGRFQPGPWLVLDWDAGMNVVQDVGHQEGISETAFSGVVKVEVWLGK